MGLTKKESKKTVEKRKEKNIKKKVAKKSGENCAKYTKIIVCDGH